GVAAVLPAPARGRGQGALRKRLALARRAQHCREPGRFPGPPDSGGRALEDAGDQRAHSFPTSPAVSRSEMEAEMARYFAAERAESAVFMLCAVAGAGLAAAL